ncbi:hypothetical protein RhiJN_27150 [Ceratobasidium sp. AG-Ba]|nr:hypothetical protein RhiJN_27150 [Ceratobasidium sp. AG-Ba]
MRSRPRSTKRKAFNLSFYISGFTIKGPRISLPAARGVQEATFLVDGYFLWQAVSPWIGEPGERSPSGAVLRGNEALIGFYCPIRGWVGTINRPGTRLTVFEDIEIYLTGGPLSIPSPDNSDVDSDSDVLSNSSD